MARNGSGTYNRAVAPYVAGTTITAVTVNSEMDDMAAALTQSLSRDGQSPPTANLPMGNFRITGLANAIASTDAAALGQVVAKAGDIMTGALGVVAGTAAAPGVFVAGDTNTGFFQAAPDTLSISVGGVEVGRYGAGGFMRPAAGTAAAPAYSFPGDTDTGIYGPAAGQLAVATNGVQRALMDENGNLVIGGATALQRFNAINSGIGGGAPASSGSAADPNAVSRFGAGSVVLDVGATLSGAMWLQVRAAGNYATNYPLSLNPNGGGVNMVGPVNVDGKALQISRGTEVTPTGVSFVDFTGIPAGVRRITIMFDNLSFVADNTLSIQLGDAGGIETTGYVGNVGIVAGASNGFIQASSTSQFSCFFSNWLAAEVSFGVIELLNMNGNKWIIKSKLSRSGTLQIHEAIGAKILSDVLTTVRVKSDGSNFDAGAINIFWES